MTWGKKKPTKKTQQQLANFKDQHDIDTLTFTFNKK